MMGIRNAITDLSIIIIKVLSYLQFNHLIIKSSQFGNMSSQLALLKQYIATLEQQNNTKNSQRQTLYSQLDALSAENASLCHSLTALEEQITKSRFYVIELEEQIQQMQHLKDNHEGTIQEIEARLADMQVEIFHERENRENQRMKLEEQMKNQLANKEKQFKIKETEMRKQIQQIKLDYQNLMRKVVEQEMEKEKQKADNWGNQSKINQLIQNYQKIQLIAKQKNKQNELLRQENETLHKRIIQMRAALHQKQTELKSIKKVNNKQVQKKQVKQKQAAIPKSIYPCSSENNWPSQSSANQKIIQHLSHQSLVASINLIRQNNKLIQRVTELQKQKNLLYAQAFESIGRCSPYGSIYASEHAQSPTPLAAITSRTLNVERSRFYEGTDEDKIRIKIQAIKHENEILLQNLRI